MQVYCENLCKTWSSAFCKILSLWQRNSEKLDDSWNYCVYQFQSIAAWIIAKLPNFEHKSFHWTQQLIS